MKRREYLAAGASLAAAAAGCTGCASSPTAALSMEPTDDAGIAGRVTMHLEADPDNERYRRTVAAVEEGPITVEATEPPLPTGEPFVHDGAVYELRSAVVRRRPGRSFSFTLNPVEGSVPDGETVRFGDLPDVDRRKFRERGWAGDDPFLGFGSSLLYLDPEIPESALVPEPERPVIVWDADSRGRFAVDGSRETALKTYRYEARTVDPSAADYGREVRRRYAFALAGLTAGEREIVAAAVDGGYRVPADESPPEALWRLADRFAAREEVRRPGEDDGDRSPTSGNYLARYDGTLYWTDLRVPRTPTAAGG